MLVNNKAKQAISEGRGIFGIYMNIPSPTVVELAGLAGLDFIRIDCYHSPADLLHVESMIRAAEVVGITPFVRVMNDPFRIMQVLEMGAMGVIIPDVTTRDEAQAAVDAVRFPPLGRRGMFSSPRVSGYGSMPGAEFTTWSNQEVMLGIQLESGEAAENAREILSVEGIDFVGSGRGDLAVSLGFPGQKTHPRVLEAEKKIFDAALAAGKNFSVNVDPTSGNIAETVANWQSKGARSFTLTTDTNVLLKTLKRVNGDIRSLENGVQNG